MAEAVFLIPELLEMIILRLPTRDQQISRTVCRLWRRGINSSIHIKRALFLVPGTPGHRAHDIALWPVESDYSDAGVTSPYDDYCSHPFLGDDDAEAGTVAIKNVIKHGNRSLRHVYLTQSPAHTGVTKMVIHRGHVSERMVIKLKARETFGSLYAKLAAIYAPDVMKSLRRAEVEWVYKHYD
ncbi:hypothetical protein LTS10_007325 [Elasticomyces elasticus]|nr:hypothetical protein LTS10_007325 [Elasticomyces elasticus]